MIFMSDTSLNTLLIVLVITISVLLVGFLLGRYIYRKVHHLPTGDCACCHTSKEKMLKKYHKKYGCPNCKN